MMWRLENGLAHWSGARWNGLVDVGHPENGWRCLEDADSHRFKMRLVIPQLGELNALHLDEAYLRGADVVATYAETARPPVRPQIDWRALSEQSSADAATLGGLEMLVSLQTSVLDSRPAVVTRSNATVDELLVYRGATSDDVETIAPNLWAAHSQAELADDVRAVLFRSPAADISYVEMVYPADFHGLTLQVGAPATTDAGRDVTLECRLFSDRLEKGVICRCRMRGLFLPREGDRRTVARLIQAFRDSPLPLTA